MPLPGSAVTSTNVGNLLQNPGDTITAALGQTGVGQPPDPTAVLSLSGVFTNAVVAVEGIPLAQPLTQVAGQNPTPALSSEWSALTEINLANFGSTSTPIGPVSSTGLPGTGLVYMAPAGLFSQLRLRLISIGSGAIQGGIATVPFPLTPGVQLTANPAEALELGRMRMGLSILLEGVGINLQDLTQADIQSLS